MMILKKKEVIACALVVLIGVAGYLNWSYQDTIRVTDGESYIEQVKKLGEAEFVSGEQDNVEKTEETTEETTGDEVVETEEASAVGGEYFMEAKLSKENARSKALEILNQTAINETFDAEVRKQAQNKIISMAESTEKEAVIENIARAKGYKDISVYIDGESVEIIVKKNNFSAEDVKTLKELVTAELSTSAKNIKIIESK
ncbi:MAG: SpoIIIAH-like family protein [Ruminococcaceae bacterium]|nr:SpoIIIAH-like family protein [Oscillospiraceae bacterium]